MRFLKSEGLFLLTLLFSLPIQAEEAKWSIGLGGDVWWFDWREYRGGEQLLVESGPMALGRIDMRLQSGELYSSLAFSRGGGKAHYDGQLQNGTPYQSDAWEEMMESELQLGWEQAWGNLHTGLIWRDWDRQIDGNGMVSSVHEAYQWSLLTFGGEYGLSDTAAGKTALAVDIGLPLSSSQTVYSEEFGTFGLEPGDGYFWRLMLRWRQGGWELSPFLQQQTMDRSDSLILRSKVNGGLYHVMQPESARFEGGLRLRYSFGGTAYTAAPR